MRAPTGSFAGCALPPRPGLRPWGAAATAMIRSGLQVVDSQAKLAQSLGTTVASIQTLERAGELAGVSMSGIEQATKDLTRRLSQAAAGTGPAADALDRLGLSATGLIALPLDERVGAINAAIEAFVPAAERAAVAGQLFGEEGSIAMGRIDSATLRQATKDVRAFGVVVSAQDAAQIERTNDAISRLGLIWRGLANQLAVAAAPALEAVADAMAALAERSGPVGRAIELVLGNLDRLAATLAAVAALVAGRFVAGLAVAAVSVRGLATALALLRGALIRLPLCGAGDRRAGADPALWPAGRGGGEFLRRPRSAARRGRGGLGPHGHRRAGARGDGGRRMGRDPRQRGGRRAGQPGRGGAGRVADDQHLARGVRGHAGDLVRSAGRAGRGRDRGGQCHGARRGADAERGDRAREPLHRRDQHGARAHCRHGPWATAGCASGRWTMSALAA